MATNQESTALTIEVNDDHKVKKVPAHIKERMNSYKSKAKTNELIVKKLEAAEQRRKEQQEQRLERIRQSEEDCRRALEYMGVVPPRTFTKQVLEKSLNPLQQEYKNIINE